MASIGENAYGGNLTVDKLTYTTLDPPIGGFVNNPLTGTLDCANNDLTNGGTFNCNTLNYTTLNPPINPGITNPLAAPLLCNGQDIGVGTPADRANEVRAVTLTGDNSSLGAATATTLTTTGAVTANGSTYGAIQNTTGTSTIGGQLFANGGANITGDCVASGLISGSTLEITNPASSGSSGAPVDLTTSPITEFNMTGKSRGQFWVYNSGAIGQEILNFNVETGIANAFESCTALVSVQSNANPNTRQLEKYSITSTTPTAPNDSKLYFRITMDGAVALAQAVRVNVIILAD